MNKYVFCCNFFFFFPYFPFVIFQFLRFKEAEDDCTEALNLDDRYIKAYSRRSTARKELGKLKDSKEGMLNIFNTFVTV